MFPLEDRNIRSVNLVTDTQGKSIKWHLRNVQLNLKGLKLSHKKETLIGL